MHDDELDEQAVIGVLLDLFVELQASGQSGALVRLEAIEQDLRGRPDWHDARVVAQYARCAHRVFWKRDDVDDAVDAGLRLGEELGRPGVCALFRAVSLFTVDDTQEWIDRVAWVVATLETEELLDVLAGRAWNVIAASMTFRGLHQLADDMFRRAQLVARLGGDERSVVTIADNREFLALYAVQRLVLLGRGDEVASFVAGLDRSFGSSGTLDGLPNDVRRARAVRLEALDLFADVDRPSGTALAMLDDDATGFLEEAVHDLGYALAHQAVVQGRFQEAEALLDRYDDDRGRLWHERRDLSLWLRAKVLEAELGPRIGPLVEQARRARAEVEAHRVVHAEAVRARIDAELQRAERDRLERENLTDPLTGLGNRRAFDTSVADLHGAEHALLVLDVDRFKQINDTHGHQLGDEVLVAVARELAGHGREHDVACRLGGDELVLCLPSAGMENARARAGSIRRQVSALRWPSAPDLRVTVSIGVAAGFETADERLAEADAALYRAKGVGGDRVALASPGSGVEELRDDLVRTAAT